MAQRDYILLYLFLIFVFRRSHADDNCQRRCTKNELPKKCYFQFTIGLSLIERKNLSKYQNEPLLTINGKNPGPIITVCQNDTIVVDMKNELPFGTETSLHWYGFTDGTSPFMSGASMITQCPIIPHTSFRYEIKAFKPGTYYYRSHFVPQQIDGIFGPIIVQDKFENYSSIVLTILPEMKHIQTFSLLEDKGMVALRFNIYENMDQEENRTENSLRRLRIINAVAFNCPITLFTHTVPLKIVAIDGYNIRPRLVNKITIHPGERIDLLVKRKVMEKVHVVGHNFCKGQGKYGLSEGFSIKNEMEVMNTFSISGSKKFNPENLEKLEKGDINVFLPYDLFEYKNFNGKTDFRYKLGTLTPYAPSYLDKPSSFVYAISNKAFLYPSSPILSQPKDVPEDLFCDLLSVSDRCTSYDNGFCECFLYISLQYNKSVNLFLIDEGKIGNSSQTFHIHGNSFYILESKSYNHPIRKEMVEEEENLGHFEKNLFNPVKKDTVTVPNKGFVKLRLKTRNPGKWLLESTTSKTEADSGIEIVLSVENQYEELVPPNGFPKCGTMKEPDLVLSGD